MSRPAVDWDGLEPHYRAGIRSLKDIGAEFEVSDAAIIKHAKKAGWTRNLKAKIEAKAAAKVSAAMVSEEVSAEAKLTEATVVEVESTVRARIELAQRRDIGRGRSVVTALLSELEDVTIGQDRLETIFELLNDPEGEDEDGSSAAKDRVRKLREAFERAMSLTNRSGTAKSLAESLKVLIGLERQAYKMDADDIPEGGVIKGAVIYRANMPARGTPDD